MTIEERKAKYFKETCRCCRFHCENSNGLPDDIGKPIKSEDDYFPALLAYEHKYNYKLKFLTDFNLRILTMVTIRNVVVWNLNSLSS